MPIIPTARQCAAVGAVAVLPAPYPCEEPRKIMSVAFRRESDDEHMEPKYELPIPVGPNLVTPRGLRLIGEKLASLKSQAEAETDEEARKKIQRSMRYFSTRETTAQVQPAPKDDHVGIGSRVTFVLDGRERSLTIVGHDESEPNEGLIAFSAPLGRALMNADAEDFVSFQGREDAIEILSARADPKVQA